MTCCQNKKTKLPDFKIPKLKIQNETITTSEFKIVLLGDSSVGKSSIVNRYIKRKFSNKYITTIGASFYSKNIHLKNNKLIKIQIWDTGGSERFKSISNIYYRNADGALLIYDVTNENSLLNLNFWIQELKNNVNDLVIGIVGNKIDVNENLKNVSFVKCLDFAKKNGIFICKEISAKSGFGVDDVFYIFAEKIYENKIKNEENIEYDDF
jgi:Ras-related protein Rab-5C